MSTIINQVTRDRLAWMAEQLTKLHDYNWVRSEGETDFRAVRQELADIIAKAVEPVMKAPDTVLAVMTPEQVDRVVAAIPAGTDADAIVKAIAREIEQTELAMTDAIAQTRADVLAAFPTNVQAMTPEPAPAEEPK